MTNFNVFSLIAIIFVVFMFGTGIGLVPFIMSKELSETPSHHHEEISEDGFTVQIEKALRITNNKQLFSILSNELNTTQEQKSAAESQAQSLLNQLNGVFKTRWGSQIDRLYNIQLQPSGENVIDVNLAIHTKPIARSEIQALRVDVLNALKSGNIQVEALKLAGLGSVGINKQELSISEPIRGELPTRSVSAPSTRSFRSDEAGVSAAGNGGEAQRTVGKNRNININIKRLKDFYIYKNPALIHQYLDRANSYRHPNPAVGASVSAAYSNGAYSLKNRYNNAKSSEEESEESTPSAQSYDKYETDKYYSAKNGKYQNKYDSDGSYVHPDGYKPVRPHDEQDKKYADGAASKPDKPKIKTTQTTSRSNNGHALKNQEYEVYNKIDDYRPKSKEYKPKKEEPSYEKRREEPEEEEEEERAQQNYVDSSKEYAKLGGEAPSRNKTSSSPSSSAADQNTYSKSKEKIRLDVETFFNTLLEWAKKQKQLYMPESNRVPSSSSLKRRESNEYAQNQSDKSSKYGQSGEEGKRQRVKESSESKRHPDGYKPVMTTAKPSVNTRYSEEYEKSADYSPEQVKTTQAPKPSYLNSQLHSDEEYKLVVTTTPSYPKVQIPTSTKMVYYVEKLRPISNEYVKAPIQYVPSRPVEIEEQPIMNAMSLEQAQSRPQYIEQRQPEYVEEEAVNDQETQLYEREPYRPYVAPVMEEPVREYYPMYEPPTTYMPMTTSTTQSTTTEPEKKNNSDDNNSHRRRKHRKHKKRKHHHRKTSPNRQPTRVPERKEPANKSSYNSTESMRLKNEKSSVSTSSASPLSSSSLPSTSTTKPGSNNTNNNNNSQSNTKSRARKDASSFLNKNMFRSLIESHVKTNNMIKEIQTQIDRTSQ